VRPSKLTLLALVVIFAGAGVAAGLMFPGHESGARVAVFAGIFCALAAPVFARARRTRENGR
jgi:hypothetical protein